MRQDQTGVAVAGRQRELLGEVYRRHWLELCRYVASTFGAGPPDPEDVAQQAFVRFAALDDPDAVDNPRAYLYRTAHNIVVDEHRRAARRMAHQTVEIEAGAEKSDDRSPERVLLARERLQVITRAVQALPVKCRRSFLLHRVHGLSCAEIARRTGYSQSAIKKHVVRALADIERALAKAERGIGADRSKP